MRLVSGMADAAEGGARPAPAGAEIILFPGIAIERWHKAARKRRRPRARKPVEA